MDPREGRVDVCRLSIHYLDWTGSLQDLPPLVLLHGFLDHAWSFAPFVRCFRERETRTGAPARRILAVDFRGHGDSGWVRGGYYHFLDYTLDVMGVVDGLGIEKFSLLGHSMGSMAASLVAGTFPERIEKLMLVEGLGPPDMKPEVAPDRSRQWIEEVRDFEKKSRRGMKSVEDAARRLRRMHRRLGDDLARFLAEKGTRVRDDGRVEWKHDPLHRTRSPQPFYLAQAETFWRRVTCPVLFVTGSESEFRFFNDQERRKCFADGRSVDIQEAGHMVHHDRPERLAQAVLGFLAGEC
jgi:pimeloyl-ACP methyl ester carboxylesterase